MDDILPPMPFLKRERDIEELFVKIYPNICYNKIDKFNADIFENVVDYIVIGQKTNTYVIKFVLKTGRNFKELLSNKK